MHRLAQLHAGAILLVGTVAVAGLTALSSFAFADPEPFLSDLSWVPGHFQVEVEAGADIVTIAAEHGLFVVDSFGTCHLLASNDEIQDEVHLDNLQSDDRLGWAELAYRQHTPESTRQMVVAVVGGTVDDFVAQDVYDRLHLGTIHEHTRGEGTIVAVIDTGVDPKHPALAEQVLSVGGHDFIDGDAFPWETANGIDDDEDGLIDEAQGHGTMVAGLVLLAAPRAGILPIRALDDDGNGTAFGVARAICHAVDRGADVINLSLGLEQFSFAIDRALAYAEAAGVVVVAAAGNEGRDEPPYFPASSPRTLSVASLGADDVKSDFSNYHETVSLSAPGEYILAPYVDGGYAVGVGTSFAAPFVSGQAALVLSLLPTLEKREVELFVQQGTDPIDHLIGNLPYRGMLGSGRCDGARTWEVLGLETARLEGGSLAPALVRWRPNPLRPGHRAQLELRALPGGDAVVAVTLHDAQGRAIRSLIGSPSEGPIWDGRDAGGSLVPAGVYFATMKVRGRDGAESSGSAPPILVAR